MVVFRAALIVFISQIVTEIIEEEIIQPEKIPHHPGLSSPRKSNRTPFQEQHQSYTRNNFDSKFSPQETKSIDLENQHTKIKSMDNDHSHNVNPRNHHKQNRNNDQRNRQMGMNHNSMGKSIDLDSNIYDREIDNEHMRIDSEQKTYRMNHPHMGGPMGMQNHQHMEMRHGVNEHQNIGQYNHHGGHHMSNNQLHQNQYSSNVNSSSNSWFSGTFGTLYEIMMILFLVGLIYNCVFGRNSNDKYAMNWYNANRQYFEERYEHIGLNKAEMDELPQNTIMKDSVIVKENPYFYKFYCSNYRYIKWSLTALEFKKRYDASALITSLFFGDTDKIVYEVAFKPVDPLGWIFCVCKKRDVRTIKKSYADLAFFTNNYEPSVMNERMCLLSENLEYFMELFQNKNLFPYYKQIEQFLDVIYFTDQASFCNEQFAVFFSFDINLTYSRQDRRLLEITHFVNLFVDTLAQIKYKQKFKEEVQKNRIAFERSKMEESQRQEIEEKEKKDFIEKWKIKNKMKYKKGAERKKLERELEKFN